MSTFRTEYKGILIEGEYTFEKGDKPVFNYGGGDGYPGYPDTVDLYSLFIDGEEDDVLELIRQGKHEFLNEDDLDNIEEIIIEQEQD